jgi:CheY-like chemotaxis protein
MGIPTDQLESIFIPFQQLGSHHQKLEGTGLGLSISQRLVETMGGQLQVESLIGKGSLFWFEMPLPKVENYKEAPSIASPMVVGFQSTEEKKNFTLLVVDDLKPNRAFLVNLLSELGFCVLEANHGQEALALAEQRLPEVILTDLIMPVMDGFELARHIRQSARLKASVIIANSASVFEHHQRQSIEAGCNEFLAKPIRMEELLLVLQKYLPIEWVYKPTVPVEIGNSTMVGPSPAQAQELLDWVRRGNVKRILEKVTQLEHQDAKLFLFAQATKNLAKNFEMSKLRELVERYL